MKKTLVAVLGLSSFVIASGKVELVNELKSTAVKPKVDNKLDFFNAHDFEASHKLKANIKENNISAEVELGTTGKEQKKAEQGAGVAGDQYEYSFGKSVTGFVKAGYDNSKLASSLKYDFEKKETFLNATYKYTDGKLTLKPKAEFKFDILSPAKVTVSNETTYKFDDMFTLTNTSSLYSSIKGMKGELVAPEFLANNKIEGDIKLFGLNTKLGVEYKATDEVKLTGNLYGGFEKSAIEKAELKVKPDQQVKTLKNLKADQKVYEVKVDGKADFTSKTVKGLKSDFSLNYGFKHVNDHSKATETLDKEPVIVSNRHSFGLDSNTSYLVDLTNGFSLTPALNLKYEGSLTKFDGVEGKEKSTVTLKKNVFTVKPSAKLGYKYDKFTASLNVETPFEFSSKKFENVNDAQNKKLTNIYEYKKANQGTQDFKFNKGTLKTTLSLGYEW